MATDVTDEPLDYPLHLRTNATKTLLLTFTQNGSNLNVSGRTFRAQIKAQPEDSTPLESFTVTFPANHTPKFTLTATEILAMLNAISTTANGATAYWDLQMETSSVPVVLLSGQVHIVRGVSGA